MALNWPTITFAQLTLGPSIDSKTITAWLQVQFGAGYYTVNGVPSGLQAYVSALGIDDVNFLAAYFSSEVTTNNRDGSSLPVSGGFTYKYIPSTDKIQIFTSNGVELSASEAIPLGVISDVIVLQAIYNRL